MAFPVPLIILIVTIIIIILVAGTICLLCCQHNRRRTRMAKNRSSVRESGGVNGASASRVTIETGGGRGDGGERWRRRGCERRRGWEE